MTIIDPEHLQELARQLQTVAKAVELTRRRTEDGQDPLTVLRLVTLDLIRLAITESNRLENRSNIDGIR